MRFRALLLATVIVPSALAAPVAAQEAPAAGAGEAGDTIIVTGTRRADRTVADSPVPVDVIGGAALVQTGVPELSRVLRDLVPSFNFPQPSITDGTDVIRPATLRGLGPDQTLVLVNGKRRHTSALLNINGSVGRGTSAVDINLIPAAAIERVEVLRDGAAAQYGSDAIAGVINFQLRDDREGARFSATWGQYSTSLAGVPEVTGVAASATPGVPQLAPDGTLVLTNTGKRDRRNDGELLTLSSNFGLPIGAEGFVNLTAEYRDRDRTNRAGWDARRQFNVNVATQGYDPREFTFDRLTHLYGDAKTEDLNFFLNAGIPLDDRVEAYAVASYGQRDGESAGFYRLPNDSRNVPALYPEGFLPLITTELKDWSLVGGLKGDFGGWRWDLSMGYGRNIFDFQIENTLNASIGPSSRTSFDSGGIRYSQWLTNLDVTREFQTGTVDWALSLGVEYRRETYTIRPGEPDSYRSGGQRVGQNNPQFTGAAALAPAAPGAQVFPGFQPVIGGVQVSGTRARENFSAYAEVDADLTDWWSLQVAGRYENYSDFGSDWNGKVATRIAPLDWLAVRAAASTGFRAPSLQQQFYAAASTQNVGGVLLDTLTLPVDNPVALALGSSPLKAETAVNWSAGAVLTPGMGLNLTVDYYEIEISDRIVVTDNLNATRNAAGLPSGSDPGFTIAQILNAAGFTNVSAARFFVNGIDTKTRGVDVVASWRTDIGAEGSLGLTAAYNWNETRITGRSAAPGALNQVPGIVLFGRLESLRIERGQPEDKVTLAADYSQKWLGLTLRGNRFGRVLDPGADAFNDFQMGAKWVVDTEVRLKPAGFLGGGLELALGANNLFDEYPDRRPTGRGVDPVTGAGRNYSVNNYFLPYSSFSPFGFNGRFVYGRVSYQF
jgi:iron complex outermembrane receptor protein